MSDLTPPATTAPEASDAVDIHATRGAAPTSNAIADVSPSPAATEPAAAPTQQTARPAAKVAEMPTESAADNASEVNANADDDEPISAKSLGAKMMIGGALIAIVGYIVRAL